jgi:hypothetical protein
MAVPLQFFEQLSCLYRVQMMKPWWSWYCEQPSPRRALGLFLGQYAYERQGRARSYPHAAYFAVDQCQGLDPTQIWQAFLRELDGGKPNSQLNPLFHEVDGRCSCACCTFSHSGDIVDIAEFARSNLADGRVWEAFWRVNEVRGVGPKIASFFLRDAAVWFEIEPASHRELLQPIDVWVRRYVSRVARRSLTDTEVARWLCQESAAPEAVNQGLWYFASQIAGSDVKLRRALTDSAYAQDLVERYIRQLEAAAVAWRTAGHDPFETTSGQVAAAKSANA